MGYYQDTTDRDDGPRKSGNYQSLEIITDAAVPCCGITELATQLHCEQVNLNSEATEKLRSEEKILTIFPGDAGIV